MKKRVGVLTADNSLYRKLYLLLRYDAVVERLDDNYDNEIYDLLFIDIDTYPARSTRDITMSRDRDARLSIPFRHEEVLELIANAPAETDEYIALLGDGRHVLFFDEKIRLTEVEYKLLSELLSAKSGYVSRESLLKIVWGDGFDAGVVNVYVHYLRTKLERDGRKVILSSRKEGYRIDERYRRDK